MRSNYVRVEHRLDYTAHGSVVSLFATRGVGPSTCTCAHTRGACVWHCFVHIELNQSSTLRCGVAQLFPAGRSRPYHPSLPRLGQTQELSCIMSFTRSQYPTPLRKKDRVHRLSGQISTP